ncbi:MAG: DNA repair protein RadC [Chloroflexi bacterium]|nr:DNA repair protein RadC [Chloroflexota bacterium]
MTATYPPIEARPRRLIRDMPTGERPLTRLTHHGSRNLSSAELLALILNTPDALELAQDVLALAGSIQRLPRLNRHQLAKLDGVGDALAGRIMAAIEIGRRAVTTPSDAAVTVTTPADAANLLMSWMCHLEQEHLVVILLDTRNKVIGTETVYVGSLNTSVVRIGEVVRRPILANAAAFIMAHNHPSSDPSPSPEDVNVTRQVRQAAEMVDIKFLDHVIIGHGRFVSLKERGLGFD